MDQALRLAEALVKVKAFHGIPCPACGRTLPIVEVPHEQVRWDADTRAQFRQPDSWPGDYRGRFTTWVVCQQSACQESVVFAGTVAVDEEYSQGPCGYEHEYVNYLTILYVDPPLRLVVLPNRVPKAVIDEFVAASRVVWMDPSGAANALRRGLERFMDSQGIRKTTDDQKSGKRKERTLHARVSDFTKQHPEAGAVLMAGKWVGNQGSHSKKSLTTRDVLVMIDDLSWAFHQLYDVTEAQRKRRTSRINERRGLG